jgi:transposase
MVPPLPFVPAIGRYLGPLGRAEPACKVDLAERRLGANTDQEAVMTTYVGVDVSKAHLDLALLADERVRARRVANDSAGHAAAAEWLEGLVSDDVHLCLEATGAYGFAFAAAMIACGHRVSLVNPAQIKAFAQSELLRSRTDKVDAALIGRFCRAMNPRPWVPPRPAALELRGLVRRCAQLKEMRTQEINRQKAGTTAAAADASIARLISALDAELASISAEVERLIAADPELAHQASLLQTIPGIGAKTAAVLLAEIPDLRSFASGKQLAAFVGIAPGEKSSGARIQKSAPISRVGNPLVRSQLVLCALSARRRNPVARAFADRLAAAGKPGKVVLVAVAKKLLVHAFGVLKSDRPFDATRPLADAAS